MKNYFKRSCKTTEQDGRFDKRMEHIVFFDGLSLKDTTRAWLEIIAILDLQHRHDETGDFLHKDGLYSLSVYKKLDNVGPWSELKVIMS